MATPAPGTITVARRDTAAPEAIRDAAALALRGAAASARRSGAVPD